MAGTWAHLFWLFLGTSRAWRCCLSTGMQKRRDRNRIFNEFSTEYISWMSAYVKIYHYTSGKDCMYVYVHTNTNPHACMSTIESQQDMAHAHSRLVKWCTQRNTCKREKKNHASLVCQVSNYLSKTSCDAKHAYLGSAMAPFEHVLWSRISEQYLHTHWLKLYSAAIHSCMYRCSVYVISSW
jgi:hypothetical protein